MNACNCCEPFPINVVTLQTRSESASVDKCGKIFDVENNFLGGVFRRVVETYEDPWGPSEAFPEGREGWSGSETFTITYEYDSENECEQTITCEPEVVCEGNAPYDDPSTFSEFLSADPSNEHTDANIKSEAQSLLVENYGEWEVAWGPDFGGFGNFTASANYGIPQEITNPDLYNLITNYNETRLQTRIAHPPTATGYLKVWLSKKEFNYVRSIPPSVPVYTEEWVHDKDSAFETYEWTGEPASRNHSINSEQNQIFGESFELIAPEDKRYDVFVLKWSLIPDYVPDDPVFNDETQQYELDNFGNPLRPTPDCKSNGVPQLNSECPFS